MFVKFHWLIDLIENFKQSENLILYVPLNTLYFCHYFRERNTWISCHIVREKSQTLWQNSVKSWIWVHRSPPTKLPIEFKWLYWSFKYVQHPFPLFKVKTDSLTWAWTFHFNGTAPEWKKKGFWNVRNVIIMNNWIN